MGPSAQASSTPSQTSTAEPSTGSIHRPTPVGEVPRWIGGPQGEGAGASANEGNRAARQAAGIASVAALDDEFRPAQLTVNVGTTVVWTNEGQNPHTVTAADRAFDSGTLESGESFSVTFEEAGEVLYYCQIHGEPGSGMRGVIIVEAPAAEESDDVSPTTAPDVLAATGQDLMPLALVAAALAISGLAALRVGWALEGRRRRVR